MRTALLLLAAALAVPAASQTQQVLFPGQSGEMLLASVDGAYSPASVLTYSAAQDSLMGVLDTMTVEGQLGVVGVYSGFFVPLDGACSYGPCRAGDFNQDTFNGGSGLNVEHTWPRSLLNGPAESDLHHLFPTRVDVNGARGNNRFAEIPDAQTDRWYRGATSTTVLPSEDERNAYSELRTNLSFEPREDHKGNVARALFYLATVHDVQTNATFPFDATDRRTLYEWHYTDPIDQAEYDRTLQIATYQSDTPNPFVLDSTLIRRAYFPEIAVSTAGDGPAALALRIDGPNPFRRAGRLVLTLPAPADVRAVALDALGRRIAVLHDGPAPAGPLALRLDGATLAPGVYTIRVTAGAEAAHQRLVRVR